MQRGYTKIASIKDGEEIVSTTIYGGYNYWNFKFPFHHYKEPRYLVATRNAIYEITTGDKNNK